MDPNEKHPWAWRLLLFGLALATLAAFWGALGSPGCRPCEGLAATFLEGRHLAMLGTLYYSLLLATAILWGPQLLVFSGITIVVALHGQLLILLVQGKLLCWPCLVAAGGAGAAQVAAVVLDPSTIYRSSVLLPAAAVAFQAWAFLSGGIPMPKHPGETPSEIARDERGAPPIEPGKARMVIYTRSDCGVCMELEHDLLPPLLREFGEKLVLERRPAEALPGIPTPTIILSGSQKKRFFPGLPPAADLRAAIETVMGRLP
jgi:hypothetical protein